MPDPWELQRLYDEVEPYLRMLTYWSPDVKRASEGVKRARDTLSTLGHSYYEAHLRSVLEAYIRDFENDSKDVLSLEDVLIEDAYPSNALEVLERGIEAFFEKREEIWEAAFTLELRHIVETDARYTEFSIDIKQMLEAAVEELERIYGEETAIVFDPTHDERYMTMVGEGKIIFGYSKLPALYNRRERKLFPDWYRIFSTLAEEYLHLLHYRKIEGMPPIFINLYPHSEEIWVKLERERITQMLGRILSDIERELLELTSKMKIGVAAKVFERLRDFYLYLGDIESAKRLVKRFTFRNPNRKDWEIYFEERRRELLSLIADPSEDLEYILARSLLLQGAEAPRWWLERGKISGRAMELLNLL